MINLVGFTFVCVLFIQLVEKKAFLYYDGLKSLLVALMSKYLTFLMLWIP